MTAKGNQWSKKRRGATETGNCRTQGVFVPVLVPAAVSPSESYANLVCFKSLNSGQQRGYSHCCFPSRSSDTHAQERKYNVILYGLEESRGSFKLERLEDDQNMTVSVLSGVDELINASCINDIYRLGKFSTKSNKPRPLLIKFIIF